MTDPVREGMCEGRRSIHTKMLLHIIIIEITSAKCSERSTEALLPVLTGNYDRQTDQPTDGQTGL